MNTLYIEIEGQEISCEEIIKLASDTVAEVDCQVEISGHEWDDFDALKLVFENKRKNTKIAVLLDSENCCTVPWEVLVDKGMVECNLVASDVVGSTLVERLTTYQIPVIDIAQKVNVDGSNSIAPTASEWQQFVALADTRYVISADTLILDCGDASHNI